MKKFLVMILAVVSTSAAAYTDIDPTRIYEVETFGSNLIVVEFTPKGSPHMTCVSVDGNQGVGVSCYPKKPELKKVWECTERNLITTCKEK